MKVQTILIGLLLLSTVPIIYSFQPQQAHNIFPNQSTQVLIQVYSPKIVLDLDKNQQVNFTLFFIDVRDNHTELITSAVIRDGHSIKVSKPGLYEFIFLTSELNIVNFRFQGSFFRYWVYFPLMVLVNIGYGSYRYVRE